MVLPMGLKLERLREAAMVVLILADILHAQRRFAAMHHRMIRESGHALVILHGPAVEVFAGGIFEIAVQHLRGIFLGQSSAAVMRNEKSVLHRHAFSVITI